MKSSLQSDWLVQEYKDNYSQKFNNKKKHIYSSVLHFISLYPGQGVQVTLSILISLVGSNIYTIYPYILGSQYQSHYLSLYPWYGVLVTISILISLVGSTCYTIYPNILGSQYYLHFLSLYPWQGVLVTLSILISLVVSTSHTT